MSIQINDIIMLNVVGTNPNTRAQKSVNRRFNGQGAPIDSAGTIIGVPGLKGITSTGTTPPPFPQEEMAAAQATSDVAKIQTLMLAYGEQVNAWKQAQGGGSAELQLAKAALAYCCQYEGFLPQDGDGFVLKLENLDVKSDVLPTGNTMWSIHGTAVFGR